MSVPDAGRMLPVGSCPFCGGKLAIGINDAGRPDGCLFHTVPPCAKYDALDPLPFALAVRAERLRLGVPPDGSDATN